MVSVAALLLFPPRQGGDHSFLCSFLVGLCSLTVLPRTFHGRDCFTCRLGILVHVNVVHVTSQLLLLTTFGDLDLQFCRRRWSKRKGEGEKCTPPEPHLLFRNAAHVGVATADPSEALLGMVPTGGMRLVPMSLAMCRTFCVPLSSAFPTTRNEARLILDLLGVILVSSRDRSSSQQPPGPSSRRSTRRYHSSPNADEAKFFKLYALFLLFRTSYRSKTRTLCRVPTHEPGTETQQTCCSCWWFLCPNMCVAVVVGAQGVNMAVKNERSHARHALRAPAAQYRPATDRRTWFAVFS